MRILLLALCLVVSVGCAKKKEAPREKFDPKKEFIQLRTEWIELLAIKHQIPLTKAEKIAWQYYREHDVMYSLLLDLEAPPSKEKNQRDFFELGEGTAKTIANLAKEHELKEQAVAAFIADMRLFERTQK